MNKLLVSTIWFVVLKTVSRIASFIAMTVISQYVRNAGTFIQNLTTQNSMKVSCTNKADSRFLVRNAKNIHLKIKIRFVDNVIYVYAQSAP